MSALETSLVVLNAYLPLRYDLRLTVDHAKPNFQGKLSLPLARNPRCLTDQANGFSLTLHAHKLVVMSARLIAQDGLATQLKVQPLRDHQKVHFHAENVAGEPASIDVAFVGSITSIKTFNDETYGVFKTNYSDSINGKSDNYVIATHCQPFGARSIFPTVDDLSCKVPIKLTIVTKSLFKVFSNASLESETIVDMTENSVYEFKPTPPIAPSVFGFVVGDFETVTAEGKVPVSILTTKGDSAEIQYALKVASTLLPLFETTLGVPYPLDQFNIVTLPFLSDAVMENWGMVTAIKDSLLLDSYASDARKQQVRQLISHQLTHQWIGNLVSFDDWKYTWLVEAFATWVGNYILSLAKLEEADAKSYSLDKLNAIQDFMDTDCFAEKPLQSLHEHMAKIDITIKSRTNTIFENNAYEKGMILVNMIATLFQFENNDSDYTAFFAAFKNVLSTFSHQTIKPFDMWNVLNQSTSIDLLSFVQSWIQYPGYPLVKVKVQDKKIKIEQNRFLYNSDVAELGLENQPFHVPLALRVLSDDNSVKNVNLLLTDRSMELDIPTHQIISLNADNQFYYRVVYAPELHSTILKNASANLMTELDLIGLVKDYGKILGQPVPKTDAALFGENQLSLLLELCEVFASESWNVSYEVLRNALGYLDIINTIFVHFTKYADFKKWLDGYSLRLYNNIGGWETVTELQNDNYDSVEYEVRNIVLQLASGHKESQNVCRKLYKNFFNSGIAQKLVPRELFSLMFNVTLATANMTEYKQVLALVKNANTSSLKHTNGSAQEVQTAAVSSLSFATKRELLTKTLHFVHTNIDSKMIELALIGYKYHYENLYKELLWAWYKVNYDLWIMRSLRKGSDWSKQIGITAGNITRLVLGEVMQYKPEEVKQFLETKLKTLPPHQLKERVETVEEENVERREIAEHYDYVVAHVLSK